MDITPMSLQVMVPKSTDVTQIQHNMHQAASAQQEFETMRRKADDKLKQSQVRHKDETEGERVHDDPDRQGRGGYYGGQGENKRGKRGSAMNQLKYAVDPNRGRNLDISL